MKFLKIRKAVLLCLVGGALMTLSCEKAKIMPAPVPSGLSFSSDIQPIFTEKCIGCHGGSLNPNLTEGNAYASLVPSLIDTTVAAENTTFYVKISAGTMKDKLDDVQRSTILQWIKEGAKDN